MNSTPLPLVNATHTCVTVSVEYDHAKRTCYLHITKRDDGQVLYFLVDYFGFIISNLNTIELAKAEAAIF